MLGLKSFYRSTGDPDSQFDSINTSRQQSITPGICDYIPQAYFSKQYFSIYIQGNDISQIIQFILWNQYYEKTILKQIIFQLSLNNKKQPAGLVQKLDNLMLKSANSQIIYLKIQNKVYNLKEKLEYESHMSLQKQIKQAKRLTIEKISQQGKWKKITIDFGPYKNKDEFDIIFSCVHQMQSSNSHLNNITSNQISLSNKKATVKKARVQSDKKPNKNIVYSSIRKNDQKENQFFASDQKKRRKSKSSLTSKMPSQKKTQSKNNSLKVSCKKSSKCQEDQIASKLGQTTAKQNRNKKHNLTQNSHKKVSHLQESSSNNESGILKQVNFNSTAKLFSCLNASVKEQKVCVSDINTQKATVTTIDIKRKQKLKIKQNSILEDQRMFAMEQNLLSRFSQTTSKNNSVIAQILSKKQQTIHRQKRRVQQIQGRHLNYIQQLKLRHLKQTQAFKNQISSILNQYSKKYEAQKQQVNHLRGQLTSLNQTLTQNKVAIAQFQIKHKSDQAQVHKYRHELDDTRRDLKEMQVKYQNLLILSKQQSSKLIYQKNQAINSRQVCLNKYNKLSKKVKLLLKQDQNLQD